MKAFCLVNRTRTAHFVGDFADREACIAALGLPEDGVARRDPGRGDEPSLRLEDAPESLPRDGAPHPL
jgi:hypothetical protein